MAARTFAIGDIHGEIDHLRILFQRLPSLDAGDTLVFLGDYVDRGAHSKQVIEFVTSLAQQTPARVVCLRGNHEDAWLRVCGDGWDEFALHLDNGGLAFLRSFSDGSPSKRSSKPTRAEMNQLASGAFVPAVVRDWMSALPFWHEDENGIYVHAGLHRGSDGFLHPSAVPNPLVLLWIRTEDFIRNYRGKRVVFGHTPTSFLPQELSSYTPDDPTDMWIGDHVAGIDTGCGNGGFLTALELPAMRVYESR